MKKHALYPSTQLYLGRNLFSDPRALDFFAGRRTVLIADEAIRDLHAAPIAKRLGAELLSIPSGEKAKTQESLQLLLDQLFRLKCNRETLLVAIGGGSATDLVGFAASIYMRGAPLALIPTTLLAMVDASIGGKTAIDTPFGKNLLGSIYFPEAVFADLQMLHTLPKKEERNGLAEIFKMGLIRNPAIWRDTAEAPLDEEHIYKAIQAKNEIVEKDPTERGLRRTLNFGHTIAHGLETLSGYQMDHGYAVAIGCCVESHLSMRLGYLSCEAFALIQERYSRLMLQLPKAYSHKRLMEAMSYDKKSGSGNLRVVLIDRIGHALPFDGTYCRAVSESEWAPTLQWMESFFARQNDHSDPGI